MAGKLSFSVAINLLTENFKRGSGEIKNGLRNIQMQAMTMFAALGAGSLGLGELVSNLIDVARQTNRTSTALKNVSGDWETYGKNQKFLIALSQKYGLYVNDLVGNFSKFTAAATNANMSMKDQQLLFESLSRASTGFGLSADETNGVFLAVTQMMGKGKIQAEELRGQLGERMPIAMQAMARAAGTTVAGLDKIMKAGKLMSADVLPKFAKALNEMMPNVNTDNIETSFNRLKNKFKDLTDTLNVGGIYKGLLDQTNGVFSWIMNNLKTVGNAFVNIIATLVIAKGIKMMVGAYSDLARATEKSLRLQAKLAGETFEGMGTGIAKFGKMASFALKSAFATFAPMVIISGLVAIYQYFDNIVQKQKELKAIWGDYQKSIKNAGGTSDEIVKMQSLQRVMNNKFESQKNINSAQRELMGMLGLEKANQSEINNAVRRRIELLKESARAQVYTDVAVSTEKKIDDLSSNKNLTTKQSQDLVKQYVVGGGATDKNYLNIINKLNSWGAGGAFKNFSGGYNKDDVFGYIKEIGALNRVNNDANKHLDKSIKSSAYTAPVDAPDKKEKKTDLQKAEEDYTKNLTEINNQLGNGIISTKEYNEAFDKLVKESKDKIGSLLTPKLAEKNQLFQTLKNQKPLTTGVDKLSDVEKQYIESIKDLDAEKNAGLLTDEEYRSAMLSLTNSALKAAYKIDGIDISTTNFGKTLKENKLKSEKKDLSKYDYKSPYENLGKTDIEVAAINLEDAKKQLEDLKDLALKTTDDLTSQLDAKLSTVQGLDKALKLLEVKKQIKDLQKELSNGIYDSVKGVAGSAKNMYEGFKAVSDTLNNVDASGFEKFLSIWDALTNTVDGIMSVVKMIENLTTVTTALGLAKQAQVGIEAGISAAKVATNIAETASYTGLMAAETAAAYAFIPFAGEGLALAQIGAMQGAILAASIPKFANGGIVQGGSISGDKILARVNAGEMILNQGQQSNLFALLNGKSGINSTSSGFGGTVEFKIDGKNLKGVLSNYDKIKSKV